MGHFIDKILRVIIGEVRGIYLQVGYRVHVYVYQVSSDGRRGRDQLFWCNYSSTRTRTFSPSILSFDRWIPYLNEGFWFDVDIFRGGYRCIFEGVAKQEVRREAILSVALTGKTEHGSLSWVGRSVGRAVRIMDYGGGVGDVLGCDCRQARIYYSHRFEDSTRCGDIGGIGSFSKLNRRNRYIDYDKLASAVLSGISSQKKLPKLKTAQV